MYLWKVRCTTARQWKPRKNRRNQEVVGFLLMTGRLSDKRFMKPIYVEYYVTRDMGEDSLREAVKRTGRDPDTIKRTKMLGDVRNCIDYVTSNHFQACLKSRQDEVIRLDKEVTRLRNELNERKAKKRPAKKSSPGV